MKKFVLLATAVMLFAAAGHAQNFGFETWVPTPAPSSSEDPQGWASFNALTYIGMQRTVWKETVSPFAGAISAKIVTEVLPTSVTFPNPFNSSENLDTVGFLLTGSIIGFPPTVQYGQPYTEVWRPQTLTFAWKYTPVATDSAYVVVFLTKWNGMDRDTLATGWFQTGSTTTSYAVQTMTLTYDTSFGSVVPDTQIVFISSSKFMASGAKKGSTFYVDGLSWSGFVGINDLGAEKVNVSLFPNPASNELTITSSKEISLVNVRDITGRIVGQFQMNGNEMKLKTQTYNSGVYFYELYDANKLPFFNGRFEVLK